MGVAVDAISGIDLIAGNNDEDMQPLVKGTNMNEALRDVIELLADLSGILLSTQKNYGQLLLSLATHTHISMPVVGGPTTPAPLLAMQCLSQFGGLASSVTDILNLQLNTIKTSLNYTYPFGDSYINSQYNNTN